METNKEGGVESAESAENIKAMFLEAQALFHPLVEEYRPLQDRSRKEELEKWWEDRGKKQCLEAIEAVNRAIEIVLRPGNADLRRVQSAARAWKSKFTSNDKRYTPAAMGPGCLTLLTEYYLPNIISAFSKTANQQEAESSKVQKQKTKSRGFFRKMIGG